MVGRGWWCARSAYIAISRFVEFAEFVEFVGKCVDVF